MINPFVADAWLMEREGQDVSVVTMVGGEQGKITNGPLSVLVRPARGPGVYQIHALKLDLHDLTEVPKILPDNSLRIRLGDRFERIFPYPPGDG